MKNKGLFYILSSAIIALILLCTLSSCSHEHKWSEWKETKKASCLENGALERECSCGQKQSVSINSTPHPYVIREKVPPSTDQPGYTLYSCMVCGYTYKDEDLEAGTIGLTFRLNYNKESYIVTGPGSCTNELIIIPSTYKGLKVTAIDSYAFSDCKFIKKVILPNTIKTIGNGAFEGCENLTEINLPDSITEIIKGAFYNCKSLIKLDLPQNVTYIYDMTFSSCTSLQSITIPEGVTHIGDSAFRDCTSLTEITVPEGVTEIEEFAFSGCSNLNKVSLPASLKKFNGNALRECDNITSITVASENPIFYMENNCVIKKGSSNDMVICIPKGADIPTDKNITAISSYAFATNTKIDKIIIPDNITTIHGNAFSGCSNIEYLVIPKTLTDIYGGTFYGSNGPLYADLFMFISEDELNNKYPFLITEGNRPHLYNENGAPNTKYSYWHYVNGVPTKW